MGEKSNPSIWSYRLLLINPFKSFSVITKFERKIQELQDFEVIKWKELLENAIFVYEQCLKGHSYQAMTGQAPAAGARLLPTLADLEKRVRLQVLLRDQYDTESVCTEATFF